MRKQFFISPETVNMEKQKKTTRRKAKGLLNEKSGPKIDAFLVSTDRAKSAELYKEANDEWHQIDALDKQILHFWAEEKAILAGLEEAKLALIEKCRIAKEAGYGPSVATYVAAKPKPDLKSTMAYLTAKYDVSTKSMQKESIQHRMNKKLIQAACAKYKVEMQMQPGTAQLKHLSKKK